MKKLFPLMAICLCLIACDDDDDKNNDSNSSDVVSNADIDYTADNAEAWGNYMVAVAKLLVSDANDLYNAWNVSYEGGDPYAETFKSHNNNVYGSASECIEEILDGCIDIASEVGETKIYDPVSKWRAGQKEAGLYAVESWYSWHSRDDYTNNIYSIKNSYYGSRGNDYDGKNEVAEHSLFNLISANNADLHTEMVEAIDNACNAIQAIPQPFRNNMDQTECDDAIDACADLDDALETLKSYIIDVNNGLSEDEMDLIVNQYVDVVVLPTYADLKERNTTLYNKCLEFNAAPSNKGFQDLAQLWISARAPWETSEAFLFGPVDNLGLDPNMDSWPLDQDQIVQILESGNFEGLEWTGEYDEDNEDIETAQTVRGFHTLEFLIFKDGEPRTVPEK